MAHTKAYLISSIAWRNGWTFLSNSEERTEWIARYQRPLSLRTLFQIPYTHLYEWVLLMDFLEVHFRAIPWQIAADPIDFGQQLRAEIVEALDRISELAQLAPWGQAAVDHFWQLFKVTERRWQTTRHKFSASHN
jgi:hypothetical protein